MAHEESVSLLNAIMCAEVLCSSEPAKFPNGVFPESRASGDPGAGSRCIVKHSDPLVVENVHLLATKVTDLQEQSRLVAVFTAIAPPESLEMALTDQDTAEVRSKLKKTFAYIVGSSNPVEVPGIDDLIPSTSKPAIRSLVDLVTNEIKHYGTIGQTVPFVLTGHGAGALIAVAAGLQLVEDNPDWARKHLRVIVFGCPMVGFRTKSANPAIAAQEHVTCLKKANPSPTEREKEQAKKREHDLKRALESCFVFVVAAGDVVPPATLCGSALRSKLRTSLRDARQKTSKMFMDPPRMNPYAAVGRDTTLDLVVTEIAKSMETVRIQDYWVLGHYLFLPAPKFVDQPTAVEVPSDLELAGLLFAHCNNCVNPPDCHYADRSPDSPPTAQSSSFKSGSTLIDFPPDRASTLAGHAIGNYVECVNAALFRQGQQLGGGSPEAAPPRATMPVCKSASALAVSQGGRNFLDITISGYNLEYVERVVVSVGVDQGGFQLVVAPAKRENSCLYARCGEVHGRLHSTDGSLSVSLHGAAFGEVRVQQLSRKTGIFEALSGFRRKYEAMPLATLFKAAWVYRDFVRGTKLFDRSSWRGRPRQPGDDDALEARVPSEEGAFRHRAITPQPTLTPAAEGEAEPLLPLFHVLEEPPDLLDGVAENLLAVAAVTHSSWRRFKQIMSMGGVAPNPPEPQLLRELQRTQRKFEQEAMGTQLFMRTQVEPLFRRMETVLNTELVVSLNRSRAGSIALWVTKAAGVGVVVVSVGAAGAVVAAPALLASVGLAGVSILEASATGALAATATGGTQMVTQWRWALDKSYLSKLEVMCQAVGIDTSLLVAKEFYYEQALLSRLRHHLQTTVGNEDALDNPRAFVNVLASAWPSLVSKSHNFYSLDNDDVRMVLHFVWAALSVHQIRRQLMENISISVMGPKKAGKGATIRALFGIHTQSGLDAHTVRVECLRAAGLASFRVNDFPGEDDAHTVGGSLAPFVYELGSINLVVLDPNSSQGSLASLRLLLRVVALHKRHETPYLVLFNQVDRLTRSQTKQDMLNMRDVFVRGVNEQIEKLERFQAFAAAVRLELTAQGRDFTDVDTEFCGKVLESLRESGRGAACVVATDTAEAIQLPAGEEIKQLLALQAFRVEPLWPASLLRERVILFAADVDPLLLTRLQDAGLGDTISYARQLLTEDLVHAGMAPDLAKCVFDPQAIFARAQTMLAKHWRGHVVRHQPVDSRGNPLRPGEPQTVGMVPRRELLRERKRRVTWLEEMVKTSMDQPVLRLQALCKLRAAMLKIAPDAEKSFMKLLAPSRVHLDQVLHRLEAVQTKLHRGNGELGVEVVEWMSAVLDLPCQESLAEAKERVATLTKQSSGYKDCLNAFELEGNVSVASLLHTPVWPALQLRAQLLHLATPIVEQGGPQAERKDVKNIMDAVDMMNVAIRAEPTAVGYWRSQCGVLGEFAIAANGDESRPQNLAELQRKIRHDLRGNVSRTSFGQRGVGDVLYSVFPTCRTVDTAICGSAEVMAGERLLELHIIDQRTTSELVASKCRSVLAIPDRLSKIFAFPPGRFEQVQALAESESREMFSGAIELMKRVTSIRTAVGKAQQLRDVERSIRNELYVAMGSSSPVDPDSLTSSIQYVFAKSELQNAAAHLAFIRDFLPHGEPDSFMDFLVCTLLEAPLLFFSSIDLSDTTHHVVRKGDLGTLDAFLQLGVDLSYIDKDDQVALRHYTPLGEALQLASGQRDAFVLALLYHAHEHLPSSPSGDLALSSLLECCATCRRDKTTPLDKAASPLSRALALYALRGVESLRNQTRCTALLRLLVESVYSPLQMEQRAQVTMITRLLGELPAVATVYQELLESLMKCIRDSQAGGRGLRGLGRVFGSPTARSAVWMALPQMVNTAAIIAHLQSSEMSKTFQSRLRAALETRPDLGISDESLASLFPIMSRRPMQIVQEVRASLSALLSPLPGTHLLFPTVSVKNISQDQGGSGVLEALKAWQAGDGSSPDLDLGPDPYTAGAWCHGLLRTDWDAWCLEISELLQALCLLLHDVFGVNRRWAQEDSYRQHKEELEETFKDIKGAESFRVGPSRIYARCPVLFCIPSHCFGTGHTDDSFNTGEVFILAKELVVVAQGAVQLQPPLVTLLAALPLAGECDELCVSLYTGKLVLRPTPALDRATWNQFCEQVRNAQRYSVQ